jgi:hypothetical protein
MSIKLEYRNGRGNPPNSPGLYALGERVAFWPAGYEVTIERVRAVSDFIGDPTKVCTLPLGRQVLANLFGGPDAPCTDTATPFRRYRGWSIDMENGEWCARRPGGLPDIGAIYALSLSMLFVKIDARMGGGPPLPSLWIEQLS